MIKCGRCGKRVSYPIEIFPFHLSAHYFLCDSCHSEWKEIYDNLVKPSKHKRGYRELFDATFNQFVHSEVGEKVLIT